MDDAVTTSRPCQNPVKLPERTVLRANVYEVGPTALPHTYRDTTLTVRSQNESTKEPARSHCPLSAAQRGPRSVVPKCSRGESRRGLQTLRPALTTCRLLPRRRNLSKPAKAAKKEKELQLEPQAVFLAVHARSITGILRAGMRWSRDAVDVSDPTAAIGIVLLIPILYVGDIAAVTWFYTRCGFAITYEGPEFPGFVALGSGPVEFGIEQR